MVRRPGKFPAIRQAGRDDVGVLFGLARREHRLVSVAGEHPVARSDGFNRALASFSEYHRSLYETVVGDVTRRANVFLFVRLELLDQGRQVVGDQQTRPPAVVEFQQSADVRDPLVE